MTTWPTQLERARQQGVCVRCRAPWMGATATCPECLGDIAGSVQAIRDSHRAQGLCACGRCPREGHQQCAGCQDGTRARVQRFRGVEQNQLSLWAPVE